MLIQMLKNANGINTYLQFSSTLHASGIFYNEISVPFLR